MPLGFNTLHARVVLTSGAAATSPPVPIVSVCSGLGSFTDGTLTAESTVIKAAHLNELRTAINCARIEYGLAPHSWAEAITANVTPVRASHLAELRTALNGAYAQASLPEPQYTDPILSSVMIKTVHIQELRNNVDAIY